MLRVPPPWYVDAIKLAEDNVAEEIDPSSGLARPLVSVGDTIPGVTAEIRPVASGDAAEPPGAGDRLNEGIVGEIWVKSEHAMQGYWDDQA